MRGTVLSDLSDTAAVAHARVEVHGSCAPCEMVVNKRLERTQAAGRYRLAEVTCDLSRIKAFGRG